MYNPFKEFTQKTTKNLVNEAKTTIKQEVKSSVDKYTPLAITLIGVIVTLAALMEPQKVKPKFTQTIITNNYYINTVEVRRWENIIHLITKS